MSRNTQYSPFANVPKWTTKNMQGNKHIKAEIASAEASQTNIRSSMKTLAGIPFNTGAIAYEGDLTEWLDKCRYISGSNRDDTFLRVRFEYLMNVKVNTNKSVFSYKPRNSTNGIRARCSEPPIVYHFFGRFLGSQLTHTQDPKLFISSLPPSLSTLWHPFSGSTSFSTCSPT